jgi:predicted AAA+ superfamily ATPase
LFELNLDSLRILSELELLLGKKIQPGNDLLFFDEVQECPKAIMSMRYFFEQIPDLHVIAAGSLLEFALQDISFPVGRVQMMNMCPLTFEEFLMAMDKEMLAAKIKEPGAEFSPLVYDTIMSHMQRYFIVGGMPECVSVFQNNQSYIEVARVQADLLAAFRQDFSKYAGHSDKRCLDAVLSAVAQRVGEQVKYARLSSDFSLPTIKKAFQLIEKARLFTKVRSALPHGIPLAAGASDKRFKTIFLDIGLLSNINGLSVEHLLPKSKFADAWKGKIAEQFVGQELRAKHGENLFFWMRDKRGSSAEVDFLLESKGSIIPVEVKSGSSGKMKSLHILLSEYPNIDKAVALTTGKHGLVDGQKLEILPLFQASLI